MTDIIIQMKLQKLKDTRLIYNEVTLQYLLNYH